LAVELAINDDDDGATLNALDDGATLNALDDDAVVTPLDDDGNTTLREENPLGDDGAILDADGVGVVLDDEDGNAKLEEEILIFDGAELCADGLADDDETTEIDLADDAADFPELIELGCKLLTDRLGVGDEIPLMDDADEITFDASEDDDDAIEPNPDGEQHASDTASNGNAPNGPM